MLDGTNGGASRATLVARRDEACRKRAALDDENMKAFDALHQKRDASQRCRNDAMYELREKRQKGRKNEASKDGAKAMSDPAFREKAMTVGPEDGPPSIPR